MSRKIKVLCISDHPMSPSGVGIQTRYMIDSLLESGKFSFICMAGAVKHTDYRPMTTSEWGQDLLIYPVNGYGDQDTLRVLINEHKPDILWFMSDPRFYLWLWEMEDEVRSLMPIVYYHVWDNMPLPTFNKPLYESNDYIVTISKLTQEVVSKVAPNVYSEHIPHACDSNIFKKLDDEDIESAKKSTYGNLYDKNRMIFFWNNRNCRRKQSGTLIYWFKEFLDKVGHDKAQLIMHTDPKDINGQDLASIINNLGLDKTSGVMISPDKLPAEHLAMIYNMADCTINISDSEGHGCSTVESMSCEVPVIVNKTGGLQDQVIDGLNGYLIEPASKTIIGSQTIPWIYEDRLVKKDFLDTMLKFFNLSVEDRNEMGRQSKLHVEKNFSFESYKSRWLNLMLKVHEESGSWENRKKYKSWRKRVL